MVRVSSAFVAYGLSADDKPTTRLLIGLVPMTGISDGTASVLVEHEFIW